ncbi:MAG: cell division protein ZapA [Gammaproteobacteria bacterium]|nr:cell division protein ZapA [Gammaproteobacteria bacterium]
MSNALNTVTVTILEKDYQVSCPPEEVDALTSAARYLDENMADIRASGKVVGLDRIAVMAALNITNDYLLGQTTVNTNQDAVESRINQLNERVGNALAQHKQLNL